MKTQSQILPTTDLVGRCLEFDFPVMRIGVAEYSEGPTGATVFWFPDRAVATIDVRGGAPGFFNLDWLRLGYDLPNLGAIAVSGGSWYGLRAAAGVAAALKAEEHRSGHWANLAKVAGAIIYDCGTRRVTDYHPDERLGDAVDRDGRLAVGDQPIPAGETNIGELLAQVPEGIRTVSGTIMGTRSAPKNPGNTTISVVVTN